MQKKFQLLLIITLILTLHNNLFANKYFSNDINLIKVMPLEVKVGQMLLVGFSGATFNAEVEEYIKRYHIGGVILFNRSTATGREPNIVNPKQLIKLNSDLNKAMAEAIDIPLFIAVDQEGGMVQRLRSSAGFVEGSDYLSAQELGEKDDIKLTYQVADAMGKNLKHYGINVNFAPVVDVALNKENPVVAKIKRSYSSDYKKVIKHADQTILGLHNNNIITALKHFPGHGSSTADSHLGFVDITKTYKNYELEPFKVLIKNGYSDMVMSAHLFNYNVDKKYPASLSHEFITNILRKKLGFKGLVLSDDLKMKAIEGNWSMEEAIILSINAGNDMLIYGNNLGEYNKDFVKNATEIIIKAVNEGKIAEETINNAYLRIMQLKFKYLCNNSNKACKNNDINIYNGN
jgi:beta-N-acetylhexosaminidase